MSEIELTDLAQRVTPLTQDQREAAYAQARRRIAGPAPSPEQMAGTRWSKYPPGMLVLINIAGVVMLVAAFVPSAIRLYQAGFSTTATYSTDLDMIHLVAVMGVLLAETGQVALTLWASTIKPEERGLRNALMVGAVLCTLFAYVANFSVVANPPRADLAPPSPDRVVLLVLEIFLPPTLVLIAANVLKSQILSAVQERHAVSVRFGEATRVWQQRLEAAERDQRWERVLAMCIRDALLSANGARSSMLRSISNDDWRALVRREMRAEEWWQDEAQTRSARAVASSTDRMDAAGVAAYLQTNPADAELSVRKLAEKLGASKHAADRGKTLYLGQGGRDEA